jgi:putative flippase GtrA
MIPTSPPEDLFSRLVGLFRSRAIGVKAMSFAVVGVINATVNYIVFWLILRMIATSPALSELLVSAARASNLKTEDARAILANVVAWVVAVSGSYVMNSFYTFAAESGRKLSCRAYFAFAASGVLGLITDTTVLLIASRFLPIMLAKLVAIGAGFVVNFSMSHFVVFRPHKADQG